MALAAGRSEYVAHEAVSVHADHNWRFAVLDVSPNQRHVRLSATVHFALIGDQAELSEARIDQRLAHAMDITFVCHAVADQLCHSEHLHLVLAAELDQIWYAGHAAVVLHDFADDPGRHHPREPRQIDGSFGLSSAYQHSAFA